MQDRGVDVSHVDFVFDDVEAHLVRRAQGDAAFDAAAGHPHGESLRMMIAPHAATERHAGLDHRRAAKFTAPHDERAVEQAALFEVFDQRGAGLVGVLAVVAHVALDVAVRVPTFVVDVDEAHAAFDHSPGEQAGAGKGWHLRITAIHFQRGLVFLREVHQLRRGGLQAVGHLVVRDARGGLAIAIEFEAAMIQRVDEVDRVLLRARRDAFWRAHIQNGVTRVAEARAGIHARQKAAAPARRAAADAAAGAHHDKARQIPRLRAEAIRHPRAHARPSGLREARVHVNLRRSMVELRRATGLHDGDVVHHRRQMRQHLRKLRAALPML